jgi:hypothetical protein
MTLEEIKLAVESGKTVCWMNDYYQVRKEKRFTGEPTGDFIVVYIPNDHTVGLTSKDGKLIEREDDFYILGSREKRISIKSSDWCPDYV